MDDGLVLGVDIGGTKVALAAADGAGEVVAQARIATEAAQGPEAMIARTVERARALLAPLAGRPLRAVGVGCGGPLDRRTGEVLGPPNLPGWDRVPLANRLAEAFDAPAWLDNDANAAALGELRYGAGRGAQDMVYVTVSTGIGGGLIVGGRLVHGVRDSAGEIGHQTVLPGGARCNCGNDGCLEALASGTGIARRAREAIARDPLGGAALLARAGGAVERVTALHVVEAVRAGDALAGRVWREAMAHLGTGIANVVTTLAPERVVIGGGVAAAGDLLFEPVRATVRARVRLVPTDRVQILPAALGQDSGVRGAVALALDGLAAAAGAR